jgi:hypothetical protein
MHAVSLSYFETPFDAAGVGEQSAAMIPEAIEMIPEAIEQRLGATGSEGHQRLLRSPMSVRQARPVGDMQPRRTPEDLQTEGPP